MKRTMNIGELVISKKKLILNSLFIVLLIAGLGITLYLVQQRQIFKSKASSNDMLNAFTITNSQEQPLDCSGATDILTCQTNSLDVKIKVSNLNSLVPTP